MNLGELSRVLMLAAAQTAELPDTMEKVGQLVEDKAKAVIGTYELGWTPLKPDTIAHKANGDTPLLETGEMRDSIGHVSDGNSTSIGSNNDHAVYQELGTATIPARSFLQGSALAEQGKIINLIGNDVMRKMVGRA